MPRTHRAPVTSCVELETTAPTIEQHRPAGDVTAGGGVRPGEH